MESLYGKCYGSLQEKLEKEKENLKHVEENLKKITGRSVNEGRIVRIGQKRNSNFLEPPPVINSNADVWKSALDTFGPSGRKPWGRPENVPSDRPDRRHRMSDEFNPRDQRGGPPAKRKSANSFDQPKTVFSRLSGPVREPVSDSSNFQTSRRHTVSSQIVVTPTEVPSRSEALAVQRKDPRNNKERNKRMFGALLGTLRQFKQDETKLKDRENKKALIEKKLEDAAMKEKQQLRHERESLFKERKMKYIEIRNIELKLARIKEQEEWEASQRPLVHFIRTKSSPHIFYLPKVLNSDTKKLLEDTKVYITNMIEEKNKLVEKQVEEILKQGFEEGHDEEMQEDDEDQALEDAYHERENLSESITSERDEEMNNSGRDQFGRDLSKREPERDFSKRDSERDLSKRDSERDLSKRDLERDLSKRDSERDLSKRDSERDLSKRDSERDLSKRDSERDLSKRDSERDLSKRDSERNQSKRDSERDLSKRDSERDPSKRDSERDLSKRDSERDLSKRDSERDLSKRDSERDLSKRDSSPSRVERKRKKTSDESKISSKSSTYRQEKYEEAKKKQRKADEDTEDVKPILVKKSRKKHNSSSSSSDSSSDSTEDVTEDEDSEDYDENKVIKIEKVKEEKEVDGDVSKEVVTKEAEHKEAAEVSSTNSECQADVGEVDLNSISLPAE